MDGIGNSGKAVLSQLLRRKKQANHLSPGAQTNWVTEEDPLEG